MISSWLRRLFDNRFKGTSRRSRRWPTRLDVEVLETRTMPTVVTWTGLAVPDAPDRDPVGNGDSRWSNPNNWKNGIIPTNGDDVVFPDQILPRYKIDHKSQSEAPSDF